MLAVDSDEGGWTEVQSLVSGQDYGWPNRELSADSRPFPPFYSSLGGGKSALGGGCFYRPLQPQFPSEYGGGAFVVDSLSGGIEFLGVHDGRPLAAFRGGDSTLGPVSVLCAQDGSLLFLTAGRLPANSSLGNSVVAPRLSGTLRQIKYQRFQTPFVAYQSTSADIPAESPTVLEVRLFDERGSTFQWRSNGVAIVGAQSHKISVVLSASDTLKQTYDCVISNALGSVVTESIQVGLAVNGAIGPSLMLEIPEEGSMIRPGDSLTFRASGIDQSTRVMGPGEFYWRIDFYHDGKVDEGFVQASSVPGGSVTIPIPTDVTSNAWYRVYLSAPSRSGVWSSIFRDIPIQKTDVTLMSRPQGIPIRWGTGSFQTPIHLQGLEGTTQSVEAPASFVVGGKLLNFAGWSDGGNRTHATKLTGLTQELTAFYRSANEPIVWVDWEGTYTDGISEFRSQDTSWTVLAPVSLDGGFDDAQAWLAWNDKVPINPSSHYDLEVQSAKFYGGILVYRYNSKDVVAQAGVRSLKTPELGNELFCDAGPGTLCWNLLYWKTEDFANHGELSKTVVFDDATKFDLLGLSGGDGQPERNSGRLRLVLREGNSFYLSEWAVDPEAVVQDASLRAISASRWALYTPLPPFSLGFDDVHATWEFKQFTNVTAVGLFHSNDSASGPVEKLFGGFALRGFKVTGTASEYGEIWRQKFFGNTDGVESADGSDPDHDGWSNLFELAIGTDPTQSASAPKTSWTVVTDLGSSSLKESAVASPRFFSLELQLNIETPSGAGLTVEMSSDLSHWIPIGGLESEGATFGLSTVSNDDGKRIFRTRVPLNSPEISNRFFRLRAVR